MKLIGKNRVGLMTEVLDNGFKQVKEIPEPG